MALGVEPAGDTGVHAEGVDVALPLEREGPTPQLAGLRHDAVVEREPAPRAFAGQLVDVFVQLLHVGLHGVNHVLHLVERREPDVPGHLRLRADLVQRARGALDLRGFHVGAHGEAVPVLAGVRREVLVKPALYQVQALHQHLDGVDTLLGEPAVEEPAIRRQLPRHHARRSAAGLRIGGVYPVHRPALDLVQLPVLHYHVDTNPRLTALLAGDEEDDDAALQRWLGLGQRDHEPREQRNVA
mmetsp:Transcript_27063/g.72116  ORF Transcript_27063/g.72116 Transcript_27063/m.72116 type:complete len:242 (+) Transcript_27063:320-1045(+)